MAENFTELDTKVFQERLTKCKHGYCEWGSGASTLLAVREAISRVLPAEENNLPIESLLPILSIETDSQFAGHLLAQADELLAGYSYDMRYACAPTMHVCRIGKTKAWGYPVDMSRKHLWQAYSMLPFVTIAMPEEPDLYLVDGRFRSMCLVAIAISHERQGKLTVMLHDSHRKQYAYVMKKYYDRVGDQGDSLAILRLKPDFNLQDAHDDFSAMCLDPRPED